MSEATDSKDSPPHAETAEAPSFNTVWENGTTNYEILGMETPVIFLKPKNPKSSVPVLIAPGFAEEPEVLREFAQALYEAGRSVILFKHPRSASKEEVLQQSEEQFTAAELRKATTIREILNQAKISKADIIAHSEGAINATIAAHLSPEKIRNMVLINPAGLVGADNILELAARNVKAVKDMGEDILKDPTLLKRYLKVSYHSAHHVMQNPTRALDETQAIATETIDPLLRHLHAQGKGIVIIHDVNDKTFPMDDMQKIVHSQERKVENADGTMELQQPFVDGFLSVKTEGSHNGILFKDKEKLAKAADYLLSNLEQRSPSKGGMKYGRKPRKAPVKAAT